MSDEESSKSNQEQNVDRIELLMMAMRKKNRELRKRHAEVEQDRRDAEAQGSSITKSQPKVDKSTDVEPQRIWQEREWDKGKTKEGDWSAGQGDYSRFSRVAGSSYVFQYSDKFPRLFTHGGFQESRQFGNSFQRSKGWNKKPASYKYPQNWRSEQRKFLDPESSPKEQDYDRVWRDEEDNEEARNKQSRVENWLHTLKDVKEWENENPCNTYEDEENQSAKDKPQPNWNTNTNKQALSKKTVRNEQKKQKYKSHHSQPSTNVQELEHHSKMLELKKNFANFDLSIPGNQPCTYQQGRPKVSNLKNIPDKQGKIDHLEFQNKEGKRASGDYKTSNWDGNTKEQAFSKKTVRYEQKQKFKLFHGQPSTNVRESEHSNQMLKIKKNYGSMDVSIPGNQPQTYQPIEAKNSSVENSSDKQMKTDISEFDNKERRVSRDHKEDTNHNTILNEKSGCIKQEKYDNRNYVKLMETVSKNWADQKPNYPKGRGRGRGFCSNWNTGKSQKNSGQRQAGFRPPTGRRNDNQYSMNQGKLHSRSYNNKASYQARRSEMRKSEGKWSDEESKDLKFKPQKPSYQRGKPKSFEDNNETKVPVKERESEGIWSDLDTEETRHAFEMYLLEEKKLQEESDGIYSDSEADNVKEGQKIIGELSTENLRKFNNPKKKKKRSKKNKNVEIIHIREDSKFMETTTNSRIVDNQYLTYDTQAVTCDILGSKNEENFVDKCNLKDYSVPKFQGELQIDTHTILTSVPFENFNIKKFSEQSSEVHEKINTESNCDVEDVCVQNITGETNEFVNAKTEFSAITPSSDENSHVRHSIEDTSHIVNIENTTYIVSELKVVKNFPSKSLGELNQTYTVEKPKNLTCLPIDEAKIESMPKSEKDSPENLKSALKKSNKDYKDKDNDK